MVERLDRTSRRIIGVLVEKELTTPQQYPLSLNALQSGCNQRSNRDPVMHVQDFELDGALRSLMIAGWVTEVRGAGSRVVKWKHRADEKLAAEPHEMAVLAELFLRGPQQPGELRTRVNRMVPCASVAEVEETLRGLADRGLVVHLARKVGERIARWDHVLYPDSEATHDEAGFSVQQTSVHAVAGPLGETQDLPTPPSATPIQQTEVPTNDDDAIIEKVRRLEEEVAELRERLDRLESRDEDGGGAIA